MATFPSSGGSSFRTRPTRILLADENADMRDYIKCLLSQSYEVEAVADGEAALVAMGEQKPDLVLADVMMPGLDGSELLRLLRADVRTKEVPIILLSARALEESGVQGLEAGADDYLLKPFSPRELLARVRVNLERARVVQEHTAQLQQALEFEAMLKRITDKVRDSLDESQILQTALQELALVLGVNCCNTALYNLEEGTSTIYYEYATLNPGAQARVMQLANFPEVYQQILSGQYCQFCSIVPNPIRGRVVLLACPILDDQRVLGDLWLTNQHDYAFNDLEIRLVQQVANQCAIALRQARLYQAAKAQVEELQKLSRLKDDFLSTVSHELRTPMSNIKMAIQMLKMSPTAERTQRYLEILQNECAREIQLINDLLDLQRLETASDTCLVVEAINLQDWLPNIIESFLVRTQQRQQTLQINFPPDLPMLVSDRANLERILAELLNNACKYTPLGGEILLSICYKSVSAATIFTISNSVEIAAVELPRIFDKFYRVSHTDRWQQGGTGLGLALVQKLVEQLQGTILVESSEGWTTFTVELPNAVQSL